MATLQIRLENKYYRYVWYPIMNILGKLKVMDRCAYCGTTHEFPLYSIMQLRSGKNVLVCHYCGDMSHEDFFYGDLNNGAERLKNYIITPLMIV